MKYLLVLFLFIASGSAFAQITTNDIQGFNELSEVQKAEFAKQIAEAVEGKAIKLPELPTASVNQVDEWVDLGAKVGKMLGGAAKELGIAANEFTQTPLGLVTMGLIIWHYAGSDLYGFILGVLWFLVMIPLWSILFFKIAYPISEYLEYNVQKGDEIVVKSKPVRKFVRSPSYNHGNDGNVAVAGILFSLAAAIILLVGVIFLA